MNRLLSRRSALLSYFLVAFGVAWAGVLLVAARTGFPAPRGTPAANRLLAFLAMLAGPSAASLALTVLTTGVRGLRDLAAGLGRWRIPARWYAALLIAPALFALTLAALSLASPTYLPPLFRGAVPGSTVATAVVGGLGAGLFEEVGWTGFATPRLLEGRSWWRAGLLLGAVWAAWHGLADYWGGVGYGSLWAFHALEWLVALTAFRLIMTWAYARTRSLLLGALLHASFTGSQVLLWPAVGPGEELLWYGVFACLLWGAVGVIAWRASPSESGDP